MNKERAKELHEFCNTVAERFSNKTRQGNVNNETFNVDSSHFCFINWKLKEKITNKTLTKKLLSNTIEIEV